MDLTADLLAPVPPDELLPWVDDLEHYPQWLSIVSRAESVVPSDDGLAAWSIDLRAKVGPLSRSKRLRMVRVDSTQQHVVFERRELDGQSHSDWVLRANLNPVDDGTQLTMELHYGGRLWEPLVERLLRDEIGASRTRLLALLSS